MRLEALLSTVGPKARNLVGQRWARAYDEYWDKYVEQYRAEHGRMPPLPSGHAFSISRREYAYSEAEKYARLLQRVVRE